MSKLDELKKYTTIVADTGEFEKIQKYRPTDSTTNPSLIFKALELPAYQFLLDDALDFGMKKGKTADQKSRLSLIKTFVNFGLQILKIVPGRVSTEVDAHLSFDVEASVLFARELIALYEEAGYPRARILIKLASTWEGIKACEILEKEGIHCNMTLLFSLPQAVACAKAKATLISPFVGRILDWYKKAENKASYLPHEDPGVRSVTEIYNYYKKMGIKTQIMGASFRNIDEIIELAGCDLLTISPELLEKLAESTGPLERKLSPEKAHQTSINEMIVDEKTFRWLLCENAMATEKLAEGIRVFAADITKLQRALEKRIR